MIAPRLTLRVFAERLYPILRPGLSPATYEQYLLTAIQFERWRGDPLPVSDLDEEPIREFLAFRFAEPRQPQTVNKDRRNLLALWHCAAEFDHIDREPRVKRIPRYPEPKRLPTAWTLEDLERILAACSSARPLQGWDGRHWRALLLTIYDTSHRIGCLLKVGREQLTRVGFLLVYGTQSKQNADTIHRLHPQTLEAIAALPDHPRLFPWPLRQRGIYEHYGRILRAAGLPSTRRDKFHRVRRTSYTQVMGSLGKDAATEHAGHSCDLSRLYADPTQLQRTSAVDVLPRPKLD